MYILLKVLCGPRWSEKLLTRDDDHGVFSEFTEKLSEITFYCREATTRLERTSELSLFNDDQAAMVRLGFCVVALRPA